MMQQNAELNILLFIFRNSFPPGALVSFELVVPLELATKEENKLHMSHLRLAERSNVSCFSLTESLCHVKLWRWRRRGEGESIERQRLLTSDTASDRSMMDVPVLRFMGFTAEPETE